MVKINPDLLEPDSEGNGPEIIDISTDELATAQGFVKGTTPMNFCLASKEVLLVGRVPLEAIEEV